MPNGRSHFLPESDPRESAKATRGAVVVRARASTPSKGDTRARIIEAAREAFSTMGFEGASLRSVAKEAGVQHQLATYYFKTKDELWMAVMDELAIGFFARLSERIRGLEGVDAPTKLRLVVREFVKYSADYPSAMAGVVKTQSPNDRKRITVTRAPAGRLSSNGGISSLDRFIEAIPQSALHPPT